MPLGYVAGSHQSLYSRVSHRLFGSRKFTRTIEYRIICGWLPRQASNILDVGGGSGELAIQLSLKGHSVTVLDFDSHALRYARSPDGPVLTGLVGGDATRLPFLDEVFDLVICNSALEHFGDDKTALVEMARVVRQDGTLLLTTDAFPANVSAWLGFLPESWRKAGLEGTVDLASRMRSHHRTACRVVNYYEPQVLRGRLEIGGWRVLGWRYYLNGFFSRGIFELHILLKWLDFYNATSRRLFPLFYPFTFPRSRSGTGYGLAFKAVKERRGDASGSAEAGH